MKTSNINIRVDKELKEKSEKIFESLGINMSIAINLFLNQTIRVNGIPFDLIATDPAQKDINEKKDVIKINNKKIPCYIKDNMKYFNYKNNEFIITYEMVDANELCIYPRIWKVENKSVIPSVIHYETSDINNYESENYNKLLEISKNVNKILVLRKVDKITIHPNNESKHLLLPENKVNGINIVSEEELDNLLEYYNDFIDVKEYTI